MLLGRPRRRWEDNIKVHTWFWCEKLREECYLEDLDVDGRIILR